MPTEIERKFLINDSSWKTQVASSCYYKQGYLNDPKKASVRIRIEQDKAYINIKGYQIGPSRPEYEYEIPLTDAEELLNNLCEQPVVEKTRHKLTIDNDCWEIDVFSGLNEGLVVAEIELPHEQATFTKPAWLGKEVTHDARYYNVNLVNNPYSTWPDRN